MSRRRTALFALLGVLGLAVACVNPETREGASGGAETGGDGPDRIAFFGFAKANSFATATFAGIEEYAKANGAEAEFHDPNFDAQTQVRQIQDAITSGRFDVFIVQANDGTAVVPAVRSAVQQGITVVVEFTPVGTRYDTAEPQVPGTITLLDVPVDNGRKLGELGVEACRDRGAEPCRMAYLEGMKTLPLDNARTEAVLSTVRAAGVEVVASVEGGYTKQSGRAAMQDILQANPRVDVVIGSSQAIAGAEAVAGDEDVLFVGNGGSRQAVRAVQEGRWFATYYQPERTAGAKAAELGLRKAHGEQVPESTSYAEFAPGEGKGTADVLADVTGEYDE
ncbi:sugar ABC transporter substrate-binding protein [Amycolatopsis cihanbeyliensis]|uniref:Monosaccharide ABC transporter substrate-binding protein (CUT2 family) n=1 Tax=Amycolatopsis cihanbeyliensis TaxID=1128664 RepID=A0A542CSZ5_AMYCI|nr:sugar ABC transporter substrate-binding protein [Amycolatopsis cihanbeyliensis]TQI93925.1 monosaccharide ABC transporter substrate-binding protein (CUT2 family) [Amycolatopsis cihanbeyliensis]